MIRLRPEASSDGYHGWFARTVLAPLFGLAGLATLALLGTVAVAAWCLR